MKKAAIGFLVFSFLAAAGTAAAATFSTPYDWNPNRVITEFYSYNLPLNLPTPAEALVSAQLKLRHYGNSNEEGFFSGEIWYARGEHNYLIGRLSESKNGYVTDTFDLSQNILNEIMDNHPWSLDVRLGEEESIWLRQLTLDWTEVCGEYTEPVPEPATMILLGSGLAAFALKRKKRV